MAFNPHKLVLEFPWVERLRANRCNNSQHCCANKVGSCCVRVGSGVQTDATTPNIVAPTMLGVVACVLAVVCKRMQQLPTSLGPAVHRGKNTTHKSTTLEEVCKRIQHCCATLRRSRNKRNVGSCWLKSLTGFKLCATTRNNIQQHATGCANGHNM